MNRPLLRALQGAALATGAPLGWAMLRLLQGISPLQDLLAHPGVYVYMLIGTTLAFGLFGFHVGRFEQEFERNALVDDLTGLYNNRLFQRRLQEDLAAADRLHFPLSLIVVDLDHFKRVNDRHGHLAGNLVLRAVAQHLSEGQRRGDTIARIGGEEFGAILPFTTADAAERIAERMRESLPLRPIVLPGGERLRVTASFGVSTHRVEAGEPAATLFQRADQAMYEAKRRGRDRVVNFDAFEGPPTPEAGSKVVSLPARAAEARRQQTP